MLHQPTLKLYIIQFFVTEALHVDHMNAVSPSIPLWLSKLMSTMIIVMVDYIITTEHLVYQSLSLFPWAPTLPYIEYAIGYI